MIPWWWFLVALCLGGIIGFFAAALCCAAGRADQHIEMRHHLPGRESTRKIMEGIEDYEKEPIGFC